MGWKEKYILTGSWSSGRGLQPGSSQETAVLELSKLQTKSQCESLGGTLYTVNVPRAASRQVLCAHRDPVSRAETVRVLSTQSSRTFPIGSYCLLLHHPAHLPKDTRGGVGPWNLRKRWPCLYLRLLSSLDLDIACCQKYHLSHCPILLFQRPSSSRHGCFRVFNPKNHFPGVEEHGGNSMSVCQFLTSQGHSFPST